MERECDGMMLLVNSSWIPHFCGFVGFFHIWAKVSFRVFDLGWLDVKQSDCHYWEARWTWQSAHVYHINLGIWLFSSHFSTPRRTWTVKVKRRDGMDGRVLFWCHSEFDDAFICWPRQEYVKFFGWTIKYWVVVRRHWLECLRTAMKFWIKLDGFENFFK